LLILTRRKEETVDLYIHGELVASVTFLGQHGREIRLGFDAQKEVTIMRRELDWNPDGRAAR
jgi:sRNA-binding carbon storage regulator CsrA